MYFSSPILNFRRTREAREVQREVDAHMYSEWHFFFLVTVCVVLSFVTISSVFDIVYDKWPVAHGLRVRLRFTFFSISLQHIHRIGDASMLAQIDPNRILNSCRLPLHAAMPSGTDTHGENGNVFFSPRKQIGANWSEFQNSEITAQRIWPFLGYTNCHRIDFTVEKLDIIQLP